MPESIGYPTIAQLAQSRAKHLDDFDFELREAPTLGQQDSEKDVEGQHDGKFASSTVSGISPPQTRPPLPSLQPDQSMTRAREVAFIFITCIAQFLSLSALNQTVAPVMVLGDYFHAENYGALSWFSASFSMSVGTFILPAGE